MKKSWKRFVSSFLSTLAIASTTVTAVSCGSNDQQSQFKDASVITLNSAKYFGSMTLEQVYGLFTNAQNTVQQQQYLQQMGYPNAVIKAVQPSANNELNIQILEQKTTNTSWPIVLQIVFPNTVPTKTNVLPIVQELPNHQDLWNYISTLKNNHTQPTIITLPNPKKGLLLAKSAAMEQLQKYYEVGNHNLSGQINGIIFANQNGETLIHSAVTRDLEGFIQEQISKICNQWNVLVKQQSISAGVQITINGETITSGALWWQITNTTGNEQNVQINGERVSVPNNRTIALTYQFCQSQFKTNLFPSSNPNNAWLGYQFNNVTSSMQVNQNTPIVQKNQILQLTHPGSLNAQVCGVNANPDLLNSLNLLTPVLEEQISTESINQTLINEITQNFRNVQITVTNLQPILELLANPKTTIYDFLTSIGQYLQKIMDCWLQNPNYGILIANIFSDDTISQFFYRTTGAVTNILQELMAKGGETAAIAKIVYSIYQMNFIGKTQSEIQNLVENLPSLDQTLEQILDSTNTMNMSTVLAIVNLVNELSSNENIFQFLGTHLANISAVLTPLSSNSPIINAILQFLKSLPPPNDPNTDIMNDNILDFLTGTNTNVRQGLITLLDTLFATNGATPPKIIQIIIAILKANPVGMIQTDNGTTPVEMIRTFLNNLVNLDVTSPTGQSLPQISSLAGFFNNAIKFECTSNQLSYNPATDQVTKMDLDFHFTFTENATLNLETIIPLITAFVDAVLPSFLGANSSSILSIVKMVLQNLKQLTIYAGEGINILLTADNQTVIPVVQNDQFGWRLPMNLGWEINFNNSLSEISNSGKDEAGNSIIGILGPLIDLSSVVWQPVWSQFTPLTVPSSLDQTLSNFQNTVYYDNYTASVPNDDSDAANELVNDLAQATTCVKNADGFNEGVTELNTNDQKIILPLANQLFNLQMFTSSQNPTYQNLSTLGQQIVQPSYSFLPFYLPGATLKGFEVVLNLAVPILVDNHLTNSLSTYLPITTSL